MIRCLIVSSISLLLFRKKHIYGEGNGNPSSILVWRIPWTEEPGRLQSMELQRVRHNLAAEQQQQYTCVCIYIYVYTHTNTHTYIWASLIAQLVKNPPAMQDTPVQFLGQEDPLEKGQATHSSILARKFRGLYGVHMCVCVCLFFGITVKMAMFVFIQV